MLTAAERNGAADVKRVEFICKLARAIPVRWGKRRLFDPFLARRKNQRFDFSFYSRRLDLLWSAAGFPDLLTRHMMVGGAYQEDVICCLENLLKPGMVFFDVGAHHGLMSVVAARRVGLTGRVIAFEPNPAARIRVKHHSNHKPAACGPFG